MIDTLLLGAYVAAIMVFLITPGPVNLLVINSTSSNGWSAGIKTIVGANAASIVLISLSFITIYGVLSLSERIVSWLTLFGAVYLVYLAVMTFFQAKRTNELTSVHSSGNSHHWLLKGFMVGISNPKDILFFSAFFPSFFALTPHPVSSMSLLLVIWVVIDYTVLVCMAAILLKWQTKANQTVFQYMSALTLMTIAAIAFYQALTQLLNPN